MEKVCVRCLRAARRCRQSDSGRRQSVRLRIWIMWNGNGSWNSIFPPTSADGVVVFSFTRSVLLGGLGDLRYWILISAAAVEVLSKDNPPELQTT